LRERLGYDGVVISDDMMMGAIRNNYGYEESIELAINAGVDIVLHSNATSYLSIMRRRCFGLSGKQL